jgi:hypothetical protein
MVFCKCILNLFVVILHTSLLFICDLFKYLRLQVKGKVISDC